MSKAEGSYRIIRTVPSGEREMATSTIGTIFNEVSYMAFSQQKYIHNGEEHRVAWIGSDGRWDRIAAVDVDRLEKGKRTAKIISEVHLNVPLVGDWVREECCTRASCD